MRMTPWLIGTLGLAGCLLGGCPAGEQIGDQVGDILDDLTGGTSALSPIGTTKDDLLVSKLEAASLSATRTICALDIANGVQQVLAQGIAVGDDEIVANEAYIAWLDAGGAAVQAIERSSGNVGTIFTAPTGDTDVVGLVGDTLILHRQVGNVLTGRSWNFRLIDLNTTADATIDNSWPNGNFAYDGRYFALLNDDGATDDPNRLGIVANLDVVDTRSGERTRVAENIFVAGSSGGLFVDNAEVIWVELSPEGVQQVKAYNPATDAIRVLATNLEADLLDVRDGDFLTLTTGGNPLVLETKAIEFGGQRQVTYSFTVRDRQVFDLLPQLVGDRVVWFDPFTGDVTVGN